MRVDITIPDDKEFIERLDKLVKASNRNRKNFIETLVIAGVKGNVHDLYYLVGIIVDKKKTK